MHIYADAIAAAETLSDLEEIVEAAADDTWITNEDYFSVFTACAERARCL